MDPFSFHLDEADLKREKRKARELRASQWWKRRCARGKCHYCGRQTPPGELTMDHVVPIARGQDYPGQCRALLQNLQQPEKNLLPMEWEGYLDSLPDDS